MASQDKTNAGNPPNPPAPPAAQAPAEAEAKAFSPSGLYIKDRAGVERPLMHTISEIVKIYNDGGSMSIYGITYQTIASLPVHIRAAINEVSGPGATNSPDEIRARIQALNAELKERSATLPA